MALEERRIVDKIEVDSNGVIFLKELDQILRDGVVISSSIHRTGFGPNVEIESLPEIIKPYASLAWTEEVIQSYKQRLESVEIANENK